MAWTYDGSLTTIKSKDLILCEGMALGNNAAVNSDPVDLQVDQHYVNLPMGLFIDVPAVAAPTADVKLTIEHSSDGVAYDELFSKTFSAGSDIEAQRLAFGVLACNRYLRLTAVDGEDLSTKAISSHMFPLNDRA